MGNFVVELYWDHAPKTCMNFAELARRGYYNGVIFHRVICTFFGKFLGGLPLTLAEFMIQTGDPTGTGRGGVSIYGKFIEFLTL